MVSYSQELAPFQHSPTIPDFNLLQTNDNLIKSEKLSNHPTMIMYFSPTCSHCIHQMDEMVKKMKLLKKIDILMVTYQPIEELKKFEINYNLAKYKNIQSGRDINYSLPVFYRIESLPFMVLYDKNKKLITHFQGNVDIEKISDAFKKGVKTE